jgi:hypothetical protein
MTVYLGGSGPFITQEPLPASITYSTANVDTAWVATGIRVDNIGNLAQLVPFGTVSDGWFHFEVNIGSSTPRTWARPLLSLRDAANTVQIELNTNQLRTRVAGVLTNQGTIAAFVGRHQMDVYVRAAVSGLVEFYYDKVLVASYSGDTSGYLITRCIFGNPISFGTDAATYSQILIADYPTVNSKVRQSLFNANGALTQWTGSYLDIDEAIPTNADVITTGTANNRSSFKAAARNFTGYTVQAIIPMFDGLHGGGTAPTNARSFLRIGGVNYDNPTKALGIGKLSFFDIQETDPATGLAWTNAAAQDVNLEVGVQALT